MKKLIALVIAASLLAACGSIATPEWAAEVQETQVALAATSEHLTEIAPTATNTPTEEATATPVPATATSVPPTATNTVEAATATITPSPIPTEITAAGSADTVSGDPVNGQELFNLLRTEVGFACATCHYVDQEARLIGPGLLGISERAATRVEGQSALEYLHTSIVNPNAYIVEADPPYPPGLMPQIYEQLWTEEELNDIIAYLFTL
jgi:mono/diheme cytochrome c family protein